jgi:DNA (cytosine-5)-methyltransferase 1
VFIIGHLGGECFRQVFPIGDDGDEFDATRCHAQGKRERICPTVYTKSHMGDATYVTETDKGVINVVGTLDDNGWEKRHEQIRRVHGVDGISPTIPTGTGGGVMTKIAIPVLTPDRPEKRQNGRRFKEDGDESFTLTSQDKHGVMICEQRTDEGIRTFGDDCVGTLRTTKDCGDKRVISNNRIRRLTPTECERLQGFPDGWTSIVSDSQRYKCLGNAVTTNVITAIFERIEKEMV